MAGPIDFASDGPRDAKPPTELGGTAGLVQLGVGVGPNGVFAHAPDLLSASEQRGIMVRGEAQVKPGKFGLDQFTEPDESKNAVDPVTGLEVDPKWNNDGSAGGAVKSPPPTQGPR